MAEEEQHLNEAPFSLIKYESEIEITDNIEQYEKAKDNQKVLDQKPSPEDVLNNMISPRDWKTINGKIFMQYVSHQKTEREDVTKLKESLEEALQHRQARTQGSVCPIRQELFSQAFDEIIRQVTINCPERGLLLMRVRDERKMSLAAYQTLYQSSVAFGVRKQLQSQEGMDELQDYLDEMQRQHDRLETKRIELISKKQSLQKKIAEKRSLDSQCRQEQLAIIEQQKHQLEAFFSALKTEQKTE